MALHLVKNDSAFTTDEQKCLVMLMDVLKSYSPQTNEDDTMRYKREPFVQYEIEKVTFLLKWCGFALDAISEDECIKNVVEMTVAIGELGDSNDEYLDSGETDAVQLWEEQKMLDIGEYAS